MPLITVLMPVKNGAEYIAESILSIRNQTHRDLELVVINDQSTDRTLDVVQSLGMNRLRIIETQGLGGLVNALNLGISKTDSKYVARLDSDDIALPNRLELQSSAFETNPKLGLCGSWAKTFGTSSQLLKFPEFSEQIRLRMLFSNPFAHSAVMFRREAPSSPMSPYNSDFEVAEDYKLWSEIAIQNQCLNIPRVLMRYRVHSNQVSIVKTEKRLQSVAKIQKKLLENIGLTVSDREAKLHTQTFTDPFFIGKNPRLIPEIQSWLFKLQTGVVESGYAQSSQISHEIQFQKNQLIKFGLLTPAKIMLDSLRRWK